MTPKELNKIVASYYKLHQQRKELDHEIDKLRPIILENFTEGSTRTSDEKYQVNKTLVPAAFIENYERRAHLKLEINKIK